MSVRLTLKGLDRQLRQLERLGGDVRRVSEDILLKSAKMFATELVKQTNGAPMSVETKKAIMASFIKPAIVESSDWFVVAETGFRMGDYTPDDLSGGFIAQFNTYGTTGRYTRKGDYRGSLDALEFVERAHKAVDSKIRRMQETELVKATEEAFR